jgi:membrane protease subunit HflK
MRKRMREILPGAGGSSMLVVLAVLLTFWGLSGFYRVQADEQGVVLRFGKFLTQTSPGLNYHLPWPIESAITPKVTTVNRVDIGMRGGLEDRRGSNGVTRDVPEESLMLTGDENIVDVDFSVFWVITNAPDFLFNIQNPTGTVKAVAESTMREIIGQNDIQPILTEQRQKNEEQVKAVMQQTLDSYGAGIGVTQVKMQKVDPPAAVIDAFRDVQAARADQERARNEANSYANRVVPEAQGEAVRIRREAEAYRAQTVAEADGEATRFGSIYDEYRNARGVTRQRMFLETLERVLGNTNKVIIDQDGGSGVVPYLPLDQLNRKKEAN